MKFVMTVFVMLLCCTFGLPTALAGEDDQPLLKQYRGDVKVPQELYATYTRLVGAFRKRDEQAIKKICLPNSRAAQITTAHRPKKPKVDPYGLYERSINLPFVEHDFSAEILDVRKEDDGAMLLLTKTTELRFVETKHAGWRLYAYYDLVW